MRYTEQGYLAIDNNLSERALRQIVVGRANWQFCGSAEGGRTAATLYSVVGTCKHLAIDPFAYLRESLPALFAPGGQPEPGSAGVLVAGHVAAAPGAGAEGKPRGSPNGPVRLPESHD